MKHIRDLAIGVTCVVLLSHSLWAQQIALTIDDAPCFNSELYNAMERSQLLLKHLNEAKVRQVVFFVNGKCASSQHGLQRVQMVAEAGHLIANHSYHHWDFDNIKTTTYTHDILKAEQVISHLPNYRKWYRAPLLHEGNTREKRDHLREFLKQHGYINGYVTIDTWEFYINYLVQKGVKQGRQFNLENLRKVYLAHMWHAVEFYENVAQQFFPHPVKHTLLLHDNDVTALFIKDLVELLREKGWTIISPENAYNDPLLHTAPDVLLNNQGRVMAIAKSKGYPGPYRSGEDEHTIEEMFVRYQVWEN